MSEPRFTDRELIRMAEASRRPDWRNTFVASEIDALTQMARKSLVLMETVEVMLKALQNLHEQLTDLANAALAKLETK